MNEEKTVTNKKVVPGGGGGGIAHSNLYTQLINLYTTPSTLLGLDGIGSANDTHIHTHTPHYDENLSISFRFIGRQLETFMWLGSADLHSSFAFNGHKNKSEWNRSMCVGGAYT